MPETVEPVSVRVPELLMPPPYAAVVRGGRVARDRRAGQRQGPGVADAAAVVVEVSQEEAELPETFEPVSVMGPGVADAAAVPAL